MNEQEQRFAFAVATMIGLVSRGATPAEVQRMAAQLFECELHPPADGQPWALDLLIS
jgi:hypothetical protein